MPFEQLSPPEQQPNTTDGKESQDPRRREPERLPGMPVPVYRKLLIQTPFKYQPYEDNRKERWDRVPAVFTVLKRTEEGDVLLGDESGKPVGWVEKGKDRRIETHEWNTRLAVTPAGERITLFPSLGAATNSDEGVVMDIEKDQRRHLVFPVLQVRSYQDGREVYFLVGRPFGDTTAQSVAYPMWIREENVRQEQEFKFGLFVPEAEMRRYLNRVESFEKELEQQVDPTQRKNPRSLLTYLSLCHLQLLTNQTIAPSNVTKDDIDTVYKRLNVPDYASSEALDIKAFAMAPDREMRKVLEYMRRGRTLLTAAIQNPASNEARLCDVSVGTLHDARSREVRQVFTPLAAMPFAPD